MFNLNFIRWHAMQCICTYVRLIRYTVNTEIFYCCLECIPIIKNQDLENEVKINKTGRWCMLMGVKSLNCFMLPIGDDSEWHHTEITDRADGKKNLHRNGKIMFRKQIHTPRDDNSVIFSSN